MHERTLELERTTRELAESHHETLTRLALAAEYRDDDTQAHTYRVADMAARIALELNLDGAEVKLIREAALLHDVGKVGIPDAILLKAGPLSGEEFDVVKTHPEIGRSILAGSGSEILRAAEEIAAFHHEWWDGSGYPYWPRRRRDPSRGTDRRLRRCLRRAHPRAPVQAGVAAR